MNYEVKKTTNGDITVDGQGVASIPVGIITGIVGNTYPQFIAGDSTVVTISDYATKTVAQVVAEVDVAVAAFIANKYPNT